MQRTKPPEVALRRNIGPQVDQALWARMRKRAIDEGRPTGQLLDDAIRMYLEQAEKEAADR